MNTKIRLTNGEIAFPSSDLHARPCAACTNFKRTRRRAVSSSQKRNARRQALPLRSTRRNQKPLFCVSGKSFEAVEVLTRTDLHPKCLSFHLPSFREVFSLHYTKRTLHAHKYSHPSWREKKKPKRSLSKRKSTNC